MRCSGSKAASPFYPSSLPQLDCCPCPFIMQLFRVASWFPSFVFFYLSCHNWNFVFVFVFVFFVQSSAFELNKSKTKTHGCYDDIGIHSHWVCIQGLPHTGNGTLHHTGDGYFTYLSRFQFLRV